MTQDDDALWIAALTVLYVEGWGSIDAQYWVEEWLMSLLGKRSRGV